MGPGRRWLWKLAWIVIGQGLALVLVEFTQPWLNPMLGSPFLAAIFLTSRFLGLGSAVGATLLSAVLLDFFVLPPVLSFYFSRLALPHVALFVGIAIVTAGLASFSKHVD